MTNLLFISGENCNFIVRSDGKSLESLTFKYGIPPSKIIALNHLEKLPEKNDILLMERGKGRLYKIKLKDSLSEISAYCNMTEEEFLNYNNIKYIYPFQIVELYKKP